MGGSKPQDNNVQSSLGRMNVELETSSFGHEEINGNVNEPDGQRYLRVHRRVVLGGEEPLGDVPSMDWMDRFFLSSFPKVTPLDI